MIDDYIEAAAELIRCADFVVAFTGAGISTDSGIPDFRSHDSGMWNHFDPIEVASIYGFKRNPQAFYDWVKPLADLTLNAQPNAAHKALATLEKQGRLKCIITQNIDTLHHRAGNTIIYELHGHLRQATCTHCFHLYDAEPIMSQFMIDGLVPKCASCGGPIKPNVILFGEQLPFREFQAAKDATRKCDLMIVIGSSLEVAPASDLPILATSTGAKLIIINLEMTESDKIADVVIHERAARVLPAIVQRLETER